MKTQHSLGFFLSLALVLLTSCNPDEVNNTTNYWNSNTLIRMQLRGKVKTLTSENGSNVTQFNENGFITSRTSGSGSTVSTTTYNYNSKGELTSMVSTYSSEASTETYEYGNTDKYVVTSPFHVFMTGLVPNLSARVYENGRTDYLFQGSNLLMISSNTYNGVTTKDTTVVKYSGKYPVSMTTDYSFMKDLKYADNGMFLTYTEGFQSTGYYNDMKYYFKPDDEFLLVDSMVTNYSSGTTNTHSVEKYTYDSKKNVIKTDYAGNVYEYSYVYDDQGNWTTKTSKYKSLESTTWETVATETRTITYW